MQEITRFENLEDLELSSFEESNETLSVDSKNAQNLWPSLADKRRVVLDFTEIGKSCDKITDLEIRYKFGHFMSNIFKSFVNFKRLKYLSLEFKLLLGRVHVIHCLKKCKDFEHLFIDYEYEQKDNQLKDFKLYLQKLISVYLGGKYGVSDETFISLS